MLNSGVIIRTGIVRGGSVSLVMDLYSVYNVREVYAASQLLSSGTRRLQSSTLILSNSSFSIDKMARFVSLSFVMDDLRNVFTSLSSLNDRSHEATETATVSRMVIARCKFGNESSRYLMQKFSN